MAQADQTVQNATFPTVRADINNNLAALFTDSSGATAPSVTVAFQNWVDTSGASPLWKKRNAANNAWITLGTISGNSILFSGASTLPSQSGNSGKFLTTNGTAASWASIVSGINAADVFASSGSWTCPTGVTKVLVSVIGGGGGGKAGSLQNNGQSGGCGGYGLGVLTVTPGTVYTVTVGSGGAGGVGQINNSAGNSGVAGGTSTFDSISATGGAAGTVVNANSAADGSCSSATATLRRSSVGLSIPFLVNGVSVDRVSPSTAAAWSITSAFSPGARGVSGTNADFQNGTSATDGGGGIGGAVALFY